MRHFKIATIVSCGLLTTVAAQAHIEKEYDRNGGHWDDYGNYHCHVDGCIEAPSRYQYRSRAFSSPRDMDQYFLKEDWEYWQSAGGCQTVRTAVLANTSKVPVTWTNPRQCEIREGLWIDEYTGEEFTRAAQLEIDHIIPPMYANASNGYQWDYDKRIAFANDPFNLIPVGRDTHRKKRERGIANWQPRDEFICDYAQAWYQVSEKYDLDLFASDKSRMNKILDDCGIVPEAIEEAD